MQVSGHVSGQMRVGQGDSSSVSIIVQKTSSGR